LEDMILKGVKKLPVIEVIFSEDMVFCLITP